MHGNGSTRGAQARKKGQGVRGNGNGNGAAKLNRAGLFPDQMPTPAEIEELRAFGRRVKQGLEPVASSIKF